MDNQIIGIAALYIVVELIKKILPMIQTKRHPPTLTSEERQWLKDLHEWHDKTDNDGRRLWYIPQKLDDNLAKVAEGMRDLAFSQERITTTNKEISDTLKSIANKIK